MLKRGPLGEAVFLSTQCGIAKLQVSTWKQLFPGEWDDAMSACLGIFRFPPAATPHAVHEFVHDTEFVLRRAGALLGKPLESSWRLARDIYGDLVARLPVCGKRLAWMLSSEMMLYLEQSHVCDKRYREHFTHPLYVFLAGREILDDLAGTPISHSNELTKFDSLILQKTFAAPSMSYEFLQNAPARLASVHPKLGAPDCEAALHVTNDANRQRRIFRLAWVIASLFHDVAYPVSQLLKRALQMAPSAAPVSVHGQAETTVNLGAFLESSLLWTGFRDRIGPNAPRDRMSRMLSEALGRNHSIAGGLQILTMLRELLLNFGPISSHTFGGMPSDPFRLIDTFLAFELAARAVSVHDLDTHNKAGGLDGHVGFDEDPLAFLLHMVDFLQEWDRPVIRYDLSSCPVDIMATPYCALVVHKAKSQEARRRLACVEVVPLLAPAVVTEIKNGDRLSVCPQNLVTPGTCKAIARKRIVIGGKELKELKCSQADKAADCPMGRSRPLDTLSKRRGRGPTYGMYLADILQIT